MSKRWTLERVQKLFEQRGCKLLETEYKNDSTKMRYIATCGHEHSISLNNFSHGKGDLCKSCRIKDNAKKECLSDDVMRRRFEETGCRVITKHIRNTRDKVHYIALCGHENSIDYSHFSQGGGRVCSACSKSVSYSLDVVRGAFEERGCELLETEYVNCKTLMRYRARCGHESLIDFDVLLNCDNAALRCRNCHKHSYHEQPTDRNRFASKEWRKIVYKRDNWTCRVCGAHGGLLNAHHLNSYDAFPDERFSEDNGVTLCSSCHTEFHKAYGFGNTTKEQFQEWEQGIPR